MTELIQSVDVPIERMTYSELKRERNNHRWLAYKLIRMNSLLERKLYWYETHVPEIDLETAKKQYANGEITKSELNKICGQCGPWGRTCQALEDRIEFCNRCITHEQAVRKMFEERMEYEKTKPKRRKDGQKPVDMTKRAGWYNPKPSWKKLHPNVRPPKKLRKHNEKWETIRQQNRLANNILKRMQSLDTWDYNKLKLIAQDRGYYTDAAIHAAVSDAMDMSTNGAENLLTTGRMSWGQILVIGALFEMTPLEFCDVFLSGYFREVVNGKWVATIDEEDRAALISQITETRPSYDNFHPNKKANS